MTPQICNKAWRGVSADGSTAQICGWCPGKAEADAFGLAAGLALNHTICADCEARERAAFGLPFDAGTAQLPEHRRAAPEGTPPAAASTPTGAPARVDLLRLAPSVCEYERAQPCHRTPLLLDGEVVGVFVNATLREQTRRYLAGLRRVAKGGTA